MTQISISLYEALGTGSYRGIDKQYHNFIFPAYLTTAAELGIKRIRMFGDLGYFWDSAKDKPVFEPLRAVKLYDYKLTAKSWDFGGQINDEYQERIDLMVKLGRKHLINYLICGVTQGPDYGDPFFAKLGYPTSRDYYDRANFIEYVASGALERLKKYYFDLWSLLQPFPQRFKCAETYNEGDPGMEELQLFKKPGSGAILCLPRPIPDGVKMNAIRALGYNRFSFHGVFTPDDLNAICADAQKFGIKRSEIECYTDGATPWYLGNGKFRFTTADHQGHYKYRIDWNKNAENKKCVIGAHVMIRERAEKLGIAVIDFQSVLKWSQLLIWTEDAIEWAKAILGNIEE